MIFVEIIILRQMSGVTREDRFRNYYVRGCICVASNMNQRRIISENRLIYIYIGNIMRRDNSKAIRMVIGKNT